MPEDLSRMMGNFLGLHGFDDGQIVNDAGSMRQQFGNLGTAVAMATEFHMRAEQARPLLHDLSEFRTWRRDHGIHRRELLLE